MSDSCNSCHGTLTYSCKYCNGFATKLCQYCNGVGLTTLSTSIIQICGSCVGTGRTRCMNCINGKVYCNCSQSKLNK